ncbi:MAG: C39 family peptidase [Ignavibacteriae bacterium]|nr:C39 family peptidase [Ignavibacteriota bacterium]
MIKKIILFIFLISGAAISQPYPDQFYTYEKEKLIQQLESLNGIEISEDGKQIFLSENIDNGFATFKPDSSEYPFNRGLPSWNGHAPNDKSSFRVMMRFNNSGWSPWLTVGYWKENIWTSYGSTSYSGGKIDYDYVVLNSFFTKWQFKVEMKRMNINEPAPSLHKLSFFVSDQRTTENVNISSLVNDNPPQIFIDTKHYYQYGIDPGIGGDICSPTSVSMVLQSYNINVDPLKFAQDNYDPYWEIFGMWPRVVQNAAEYNLSGAVTRYRCWSEAYDVLANGGRVVMSVGPPLYSGHLMMLAGFDESGNPLVHDPAKTNGYGYKFNKKSLSESWFNKGGIAYTFFLEDSASIVSVDNSELIQLSDNYNLSVYPNPFNPQTNITFETKVRNQTEIIVYDLIGREVEKIFKDIIEPGSYIFNWNASNLPSGMYLIRVISGNYSNTIKAFLVK